MELIRHYCALMRKNFIVWKRSWVSSLIEILIPIALCLSIVWNVNQGYLEVEDYTGMVDKYK
jgi:hypothetical protein